MGDAMTKGWLLVPAWLVVLSFSGCADQATAEKTFQQTVDVINELSGILERSFTVRDAAPKLRQVIHKLEKVRDEGNRVRVTRPQMAAIQNRFMADFKKAHQRFVNAERGLRARDPGGAWELDSVLGRFRDIMERK
jgi:hypothetical protein